MRGFARCSAYASLLSLMFFSTPAWPQEFTEGVVSALSIEVDTYSARTFDNVVFETEVIEDSPFIRLQFSEIADTSDSSYEIVIRDLDNEIVETFSKQRFARGTAIWTRTIPRGYALIQVRASHGELPTGLRFRIAGIMRYQDFPRVESITRPSDIDEIAAVTDPGLKGVARAIAKLSFIKDGFQRTCTGFMISENRMVTNHHCIADDPTCWSTLATFGYEYDDHWRKQPGTEVRCERVAKASEVADLSIIVLEGHPGRSDEWGALSISPQQTILGLSASIIQHPSGETKKAVTKNCQVIIVSAENASGKAIDFAHTCDTETGSSGSPILDENFQVVGIHHLGFVSESQWSDKNRAVESSRLLELLSELDTNPD